MSATVEEVIQEAQRIVGEVVGPGVQAYGEDEMRSAVVRGFNAIFKKRFWEQYAEWFLVTLDGTTGIITTDTFENVQDLDDFARVCRANSNVDLPRLSRAVNPATLTGTSVRFWTSLPVSHADYPKRKLKFYPLTATGSLSIYARAYPRNPNEPWTNEDEMHFDKDMLTYSAAWQTLANDDLNGSAADAAKEMMEMRYRDITKGLTNHEFAISGSGQAFPNTWQEMP